MKNKIKFLTIGAACLAAVILSGCAAFQVKVPTAKLTINPKTGEVSWSSPKDTKLTGLAVSVATNGTFTATVTSWEDLLNPTNITATANGQADLIAANGKAITDGINAAANAAGALTAAAAKTAVKP